jgi:hypothetical protein
MSSESILLTHAEVTVAVAGFASVVAVLRYPLSPLLRQRFLMILLTSLASVLSALVPVWLSASDLSAPSLWRVSSVILLAIILVVSSISIPPMRALGGRATLIINRPVTHLLRLSVVILLGLLVVNVFGTAPSFGFYYAALLCGLINSFVVFADVVLHWEDSPS